MKKQKVFADCRVNVISTEKRVAGTCQDLPSDPYSNRFEVSDWRLTIPSVDTAGYFLRLMNIFKTR